MSRYEAHFETDWTDLDIEEAVIHAYAIGVAEMLGERNREHLEAIYDAMPGGYERSVVELAFEEGRQDAGDIDREADIWEALITERGETAGGLDTAEIPSLVRRASLLDGFNLDRPEQLDVPGFLKRE